VIGVGWGLGGEVGWLGSGNEEKERSVDERVWLRVGGRGGLVGGLTDLGWMENLRERDVVGGE